MSWTLTGGGDHEGEDWTPTSATVGGTHYGIGTFTIGSGVTLTLDTGNAFYVYAVEALADATCTIAGNAKGYAGGTKGIGACGTNGAGAGGGTRGRYNDESPDKAQGGGGGGHGGAGGDGEYVSGDVGLCTGAGGVECNDNTNPTFLMGSGGAGGGGAGAYGGGGVLIMSNTLSFLGTINCNGANGTGGNYGGGGGGAGGGIIFICGDGTITGTFTCTGGTGGADTAWGGDGGSGAGGRIKIFYANSLDTTGITTTVTGGAAVGGGGAGAAGTYMTEELGTCTSAIAFGQTFTIGSDSASMVEKIILYVRTVNTAGDFTMKVWDSTSKNTEYATKTVAISGTGEVTFTFAAWARVPNGESAYYFEVLADGAGDVLFSVYGYSTFTGDYYFNVNAVSYFDAYLKLYSVDHVKGAIAYNTADTTVKCNLTNLMLIGAVHRVNVDGTGTLQYIDDFTTNKYLGDYTAISGVTHDTTDDELDIADSGYISYTIDTKYPVTGIPTLTATINITAGTPTIKISSDNVTYYDIDTAIVDNVSTSYPLDNATSLSLKGLTTFYLKLDCAGDGTNTCSVITMQLDVATVTETAENPLINTGAANTFRLDQDSDSGLDCTLALIYEDRKWAS